MGFNRIFMLLILLVPLVLVSGCVYEDSGENGCPECPECPEVTDCSDCPPTDCPECIPEDCAECPECPECPEEPETPETYTCCFDDLDGECYDATIESCRADGGVIMNCLPALEMGELPAVGNASNLSVTNGSAQSEWVSGLQRAINESRVHNNTYVPTTYDCDDFADDLERNLSSRGYNATFTTYWYNNGTDILGHAITDVHAPDGSVVFVEPQGGRFVNMDADGDGRVTARDGQHRNTFSPTEGGRHVETFPDRPTAQGAGVPID